MKNSYDKPALVRTKASPAEKELSNSFAELSSSLYVLAIKFKGFHWNLVGNQFFPVHADLDCQIDAMLDFGDGAAELVRQLDDSPAPISMSKMIDLSIISENTKNSLVRTESVFPQIVKDYKSLVKFCENINIYADENERQDLVDFSTSIITHLKKYIWQYESAMK